MNTNANFDFNPNFYDFFDFYVEEYDDELDSITATYQGEIIIEWLQAKGYTPEIYLDDEAGESTRNILINYYNEYIIGGFNMNNNNLNINTNARYGAELVKIEKSFSVASLIEELNAKRTDIDFDFIYEYEHYSNYIMDIITTAAESYIDIYYGNLKAFAVEHIRFLEEAISSGYVDIENYNFYNHIQSAQFLYYDYKLSGNQKEGQIYYILKSLQDNGIEEITEEEYNIIYGLEDVEKISELYDVVSEILESHTNED